MKLDITFHKSVYPLDVLKKASYRYIDSFSVDFNLSDNLINCTLNFNEKFTDKQCEYYLDQFKKEVLDQDLREKIKKETEPVRNLILAQAFSKTELIKDE